MPAVFALEDGSAFHGTGFGATGTVTGEAVFNTSLTGYQEILTDPSYRGQIVTMTAPQIGNYGINPEDSESDHPQVSGFVVREISPIASNWRSVQTLPDYLAAAGIPGISGVDTRALTRRIRSAGAMKSCLSVGEIGAEEAVERARAWAGLVGVDYVQEVTRPSVGKWSGSATRTAVPTADRPRYRVAAIDYGAKESIFRQLASYGFEVVVFPARATPAEIAAVEPDAVFLSNGPGDPAAVGYAHETVRALLDEYPTFGICFGHQVITHALGGETFKLKFGHRGGNQPVKDLLTGRVIITSQNHGFATVPASLEGRAEVTEINLNDDTVAGLRLRDKPVFSVQYHPEAGPGPHDGEDQFEKFYQMVDAAQRGQSAPAEG
jgi:carbamoyl-phosphate synthase small subunit